MDRKIQHKRNPLQLSSEKKDLDELDSHFNFHKQTEEEAMEKSFGSSQPQPPITHKGPEMQQTSGMFHYSRIKIFHFSMTYHKTNYL